MNDLALADVERRLRRLERQNRVAALALGSIAASHAQQTVLSAYEVRAQRFTLLDPKGGVADDWYTTSTRAGGTSIISGSYSGWGFSRP
jgi:hypothetical protein